MNFEDTLQALFSTLYFFFFFLERRFHSFSSLNSQIRKEKSCILSSRGCCMIVNQPNVYHSASKPGKFRRCSFPDLPTKLLGPTGEVLRHASPCQRFESLKLTMAIPNSQARVNDRSANKFVDPRK